MGKTFKADHSRTNKHSKHANRILNNVNQIQNCILATHAFHAARGQSQD